MYGVNDEQRRRDALADSAYVGDHGKLGFSFKFMEGSLMWDSTVKLSISGLITASIMFYVGWRKSILHLLFGDRLAKFFEVKMVLQLELQLAEDFLPMAIDGDNQLWLTN